MRLEILLNLPAIRLTISPTVVSRFAAFEMVKAFLYIALIKTLRILKPTKKHLYRYCPLSSDVINDIKNKATAYIIPCHTGAVVKVNAMRRLKIIEFVKKLPQSLMSFQYLKTCGDANDNTSIINLRNPAK